MNFGLNDSTIDRLHEVFRRYNEVDEVIIYGPGISLKELSERIGTIPYELLTNISSRVKRVYYLD